MERGEEIRRKDTLDTRNRRSELFCNPSENFAIKLLLQF